jgi:D-alanyl-D-alanine carboxypeptidase
MIRRSGTSRGLSWGIISFIAAFALVAAMSDPAEAARKRKKAAKTYSKAATYRPPFAAFVIDANSGAVLHANSADSLRHPASLTKIMTLYLLFEKLEAGKIKLDTPLMVSARAASQAPSKLGLKPGQTISAEDAIKALVTKSANDIAVVVAEAVAGDEDEFAREMTRKARALGMTHTIYRNASGLPDLEQVTTAREQALLGRAVQDRFPRYYRYFATAAFHYNGRAMRNHNKLLGSVTGIDGIKTGYTNASGFNLVSSMRRGGRHIVAVVLGGRSGGSRDAHMRELVGKYIEAAAATRTTPVVAEAAEPPRAAAKFAVASVPPSTPAGDPTPTATLAEPASAPAAVAPPPGSTDPIRPVMVKTISVKAAVASTNSFASAQTSSAQAAPAAQPTTAEPALPASGARAGVPATEAAPVQVASAEQGSATAVVPLSTKSNIPTPPMPRAHPRSGWVVQVGAFEDEKEAKQRLNSAQIRAKTLLGSADAFTEKVVKGDKALYRARFAGLDKEKAEAACRYLKRNEIACVALKN